MIFSRAILGFSMTSFFAVESPSGEFSDFTASEGQTINRFLRRQENWRSLWANWKCAGFRIKKVSMPDAEAKRLNARSDYYRDSSKKIKPRHPRAHVLSDYGYRPQDSEGFSASKRSEKIQEMEAQCAPVVEESPVTVEAAPAKPEPVLKEAPVETSVQKAPAVQEKSVQEVQQEAQEAVQKPIVVDELADDDPIRILMSDEPAVKPKAKKKKSPRGKRGLGIMSGKDKKIDKTVEVKKAKKTPTLGDDFAEDELSKPRVVQTQPEGMADLNALTSGGGKGGVKMSMPKAQKREQVSASDMMMPKIVGSNDDVLVAEKREVKPLERKINQDFTPAAARPDNTPVNMGMAAFSSKSHNEEAPTVRKGAEPASGFGNPFSGKKPTSPMSKRPVIGSDD